MAHHPSFGESTPPGNCRAAAGTQFILQRSVAQRPERQCAGSFNSGKMAVPTAFPPGLKPSHQQYRRSCAA
jgi:hypothetical protein